MLDVLIEGATVVDGTGQDAVVVPVGIEAGRLRLGDALVGSSARRHIDGTGLVLCPGFVDVHTHFDAQVFWDPFLTPSSLHGVTTVVAGNCGFSIAPLDEVDADYMMRLLARVEGIPLAALQEGVPWNWSTFGEYLGAVAAARPALNFGAMVGHSALAARCSAWTAARRPLTATSLDRLRQALRQAMEAGAMGFSSSWGGAHFDGNGDPVPSRNADAAELIGLCEELAAFPGTQVEFIPTMHPFSEAHIDLMTNMSVAARSPLNWNVLITLDAEECEGKLSASDHAAANGGRVVALSYPGPMQAARLAPQLGLRRHSGLVGDDGLATGGDHSSAQRPGRAGAAARACSAGRQCHARPHQIREPPRPRHLYRRHPGHGRPAAR